MIDHLIKNIKRDKCTKFTYIVVSDGSMLMTLAFTNKIYATVKRQMTQLVTPVYKFNLTTMYIKVFENTGTSMYGIEWERIFYI